MDAALFQWINGAGTPALDDPMWLVTELGRGEYAVLIATLFCWAARRRVDVLMAAALVVAALLAGAVTEVLKDAVGRSRPLGTPGVEVRVVGEELRARSFPSGHTACAAALWTAGATMVGGPVAWAVGGVMAGLVGFSRIYVGAHFPGDVLAGGLLGACAGVLTARLHAALAAWWARRRRGPGSGQSAPDV